MFINVDGIEINYIDEQKSNQKNVILLIHGWGCNGEVYRGLIDFFSENFRVVVPDLPGFGNSSEPSKPYSVYDYADFLTKFCRALNLSDFIIFGHSLGGRIAIKLLSDSNCPFKVKRVILTGAAGIKPKKTFKAKVRTICYKLGRRVLSLINPAKVEEYRKKHGSADYLASSPLMRQSLVKIVNEDLKPLLKNVKQETLLVWGENDDQTPLSDGKIMEKLMPDAGLAVINGAGHYAFLEQPELFKSILRVYLSETT